MEYFEDCTTDRETHIELWKLLCCEFLHQEHCRDLFQRFRLASRRWLDTPSGASLQTPDEILLELTRVGVLDVGKYITLKQLLKGVDTASIRLIEKAESKIQSLKESALCMRISVKEVEPESRVFETIRKIELIFKEVLKFIMCKVNQGVRDAGRIIQDFNCLKNMTDDMILIWHGKNCRCRTEIEQEVIQQFAAYGSLQLSLSEENFRRFKEEVAPLLKHLLRDFANTCMRRFLQHGELVSVGFSSVWLYWRFKNLELFDLFWTDYNKQVLVDALQMCFNSKESLMLFNVGKILFKVDIREEDYRNYRRHLEAMKGEDVCEMTTIEEQPAMKEIEEKLKHSRLSVIPTQEGPLYKKEGKVESTSTKDPMEEYFTKGTRAELKDRDLTMSDTPLQERLISRTEEELDPLTGLAETSSQKSFSKEYSRKGIEVQTKQSSLRKLEDPKHEHMSFRQLSDKVLKKPSRTVQFPKLSHLFDINSQIGDDEHFVHVGGVIFLSGRIVIADKENKKLKVFRTDGTYLSSRAVGDMSDMDRITRVSATEFALLGWVKEEISFWSIPHGRIIISRESFKSEGAFIAFDYNGLYFCLLSAYRGNVQILNHDGRKVRKFSVMKEDIHLNSHVHMDAKTNNIYITCIKGVACVSMEGDLLWKTDIPMDATGITEINGMLCVSSTPDRSLHLISKEGEYHGLLLKTNFLPRYLNYDNVSHLLLVSNSYEAKISVFSVEA